ncbi:MAG: ECF-type sigma factor [Blastocatellia bacterium]
MLPQEICEFDQLFQRWQGGEKDSVSRMIELAYGDLRRIARSVFRGEYTDNTLQPTAIAHEACLRILRCDPLRLADRNHFFAMAVILMRNSIIDHLRKRPVYKRGNVRIPIDEIELALGPRVVELIDIEFGLRALEKVSPRARRIVELRYIVGLNECETADLLGISVTTLKRDWNFAKGLMAEHLGGATQRLVIATSRSSPPS